MQEILKSRVFAFVAGIVFIVLDQAVKILCLTHLKTNSFRAGGDFLSFDIELHHNPGAFLSLGASLPPQLKQLIFIAGVSIVICWATYWAFSHWYKSIKHALPIYFIALGGASNLIDRIFRDGHVVDYMILSIGPIHTGVFNIADIAITVGAIALAIDIFAKQRTTSKTSE
ncbi:Lipoprotein signal peptidase [Pseudomonas fluorescens]|uniref:signal peptidase II n=1 Tax=Pseudomonas fluorescens TaxID=294 RepID=UPI001241DB54|nr:signal peptidase II [Pseudomonas fluorescens]VVP68432.1 Lipoprotein signal peptidase [Pseudomonas fluorescens]